MNDTKNDEVRAVVRDHYGKVARAARPGPERAAPGCCGPAAARHGPHAATLGYSAEEQAAAPQGADLGLGCGNPTAIAALEPGQTVLDLGAGGGFDCFLAARQVGPTGRVIGVDMTPDMVSRARANARAVAADRVDFRLGEIEHLPVGDAMIDVILSNCVINLSPDKPAVFREAFRVLRPGGRLAISDVVATAPIPAALQDAAVALTGCVSGAATVDELHRMLGEAGFVDVTVTIAPRSAEIVGAWMPGVERFVASATIEARKPAAGAAAGSTACCGSDCCA
jgi:arsenite methyltransferase